MDNWTPEGGWNSDNSNNNSGWNPDNSQGNNWNQNNNTQNWGNENNSGWVPDNNPPEWQQNVNQNGFNYGQNSPQWQPNNQVNNGGMYNQNAPVWPQNQSMGQFNQPVNSVKGKKVKKPKKPKKRRGCLFSIFRFFFILFLIIAVIVGICAFVNHSKTQKEYKLISDNIPIMSADTLFENNIEVWKTEASDIDGLTKYEKYQKGLSLEDDSDTDGDGLSDKEELEVYKTDPLKISSSGDAVPDGVKVENNLDLSKKYSNKDMKDLNVNAFWKYDNISVKNTDSENALMNIYEQSDYTVNGITPVRNYAVHSYTGKIEFDFSKDIEGLSSYLIIKEDSSIDKNYEELKDSKGKVSVKLNGDYCVVSLIDTSNISFDFFSSVDSLETSGGDAYLIISPISYITGKYHCYMWESSLFKSDSTTRSDVVASYLSSSLGAGVELNHFYVNPIELGVVEKVFGYVLGGSLYKNMLSEQGMEVSNEDVSLFTKAMQIFMVGFHLDGGNWGEVFVNPETEEELKEKPSKYMSTFNVAKDALPFANLSTYLSPGGNCAGFSWITSRVFNSNSIKSEGNFVHDEMGKLDYDINNSDFDTFFDKYLYDYKSRTYWDDKYGNLKSIKYENYEGTDGDFIKFLGYSLYYSNSHTTPRPCFYNSEYKWSDFEKVKNYFAGGDRVCSVSMSSGGSGHSILCYGLEQDKDNPNIWYLYVYDNNFPNHLINGKYRVNNKLKVTRIEHLFGEDTFEWDYYPSPDICPNYRYSSKFVPISFESGTEFGATALQLHALCLYDENLNELY